MDENAVELVRQFFEQGKPVGVICHGPWMLVEAGVVRDRTVTSWPSLRTDIRNAGGNWVDQEVVVEDGLVTSRKPDDLPAFNAKIVEEFAEGRHAKQAQQTVPADAHSRVDRQRLVGEGGSPTSCRSEPYGPECLTVLDTHLPNALDLFALVPYLALKAAGSAFRSVQQDLAAFTVAACCWAAAAFAVFDTQLPKALAWFLPVPYLAANAAGSAVRSVRHCAAAVDVFFAFCCASLETHFPNAFERFVFVP